MSEIKLRKAKRADIDALVELEVLLAEYHHKIEPEYWKSPRTARGHFKKLLAKEMIKRDALILVVEAGGKIIGHFTGEIMRPKAMKPKIIGHVGHGFLLEKYRGQGIAKKAVGILIKWFKRKGAKVAELSVDSRNVAGLHAWRSLGFKEFVKKMKMEI